MSVNRVLKKLTDFFTAVSFLAIMTAIGTSIFGPAHDDFWHTITPGNVCIRMGKYGLVGCVKPWVAVLYDWSLWIGLGSVASSVLTAYILKRWNEVEPESK
jgi:hypothetical protein